MNSELRQIQMNSRRWLLAPAAVLFVVDAGLTLAGQTDTYWAGDYGTAVEGNPIAHPLLVRSPWLFAGLAVVWLAIFSAVVLFWRHPTAVGIAVLIAVAHAIGGASWITRVGSWGLFAAGAYIALAAQAAGWCWRRSANLPIRPTRNL
jgi:hypothetical protein